jgi:hypothetical protein
MAKRIFLATPDLLFRSKLAGAVAAARGEVTRDEAACDLAVVTIDGDGAIGRIRALVQRGVPVLAHGSHVRADLLRAAREAGAAAVPNSQAEERLRELLRA